MALIRGPGGLLRAAGYSWAGLRAAYVGEEAFRSEVWAAVVLVPLAVLIGPDRVARALMVGSVLLVLVVELLNSAVEAVVDRVSIERHPLAGRAKDIGSAAVILSMLNAAAVWALVLLG